MSVRVFIIWLCKPAYPLVLRIERTLRSANLVVEIPSEVMQLKKALRLARRRNDDYVIIVGERELAEGRFTVKRMLDFQQYSLGEKELLEFLSESCQETGTRKT